MLVGSCSTLLSIVGIIGVYGILRTTLCVAYLAVWEGVSVVVGTRRAHPWTSGKGDISGRGLMMVTGRCLTVLMRGLRWGGGGRLRCLGGSGLQSATHLAFSNRQLVTVGALNTWPCIALLLLLTLTLLFTLQLLTKALNFIKTSTIFIHTTTTTTGRRGCYGGRMVVVGMLLLGGRRR